MKTYPPDYRLVIFILINVKALVTASNTYKTFFHSIYFRKSSFSQIFNANSPSVFILINRRQLEFNIR